MRVPSMRAFRTSGWAAVSQAGGVAVGVQKITRTLFSCASARNLSNSEKSNWPSSRSATLHANSNTRTVSRPHSFIRSRSDAHRDSSQCSG
jgi:hypothetical protein